MCKMITLAVKRIQDGSNEIIELDDISVRKEWSFAENIAEGIMTLVQQNAVFEAVIGSGQAYSIEDWLAECFKLIKKDWRNYVREKKILRLNTIFSSQILRLSIQFLGLRQDFLAGNPKFFSYIVNPNGHKSFLSNGLHRGYSCLVLLTRRLSNIVFWTLRLSSGGFGLHRLEHTFRLVPQLGNRLEVGQFRFQ